MQGEIREHEQAKRRKQNIDETRVTIGRIIRGRDKVRKYQKRRER